MKWQIAYFREDVQDAIMAFPGGIQARYIHLTERMLAFGPDLGMPHTRAMGKGLFELRMKSPQGIGRVFFCTLSGRRIMMLDAARIHQEIGEDAGQRIENRTRTLDGG